MATTIFINILITVIVVAVVLYLSQRLPLKPHILQLIQIIVIVIGLAVMLKHLGLF